MSRYRQHQAGKMDLPEAKLPEPTEESCRFSKQCTDNKDRR